MDDSPIWGAISQFGGWVVAIILGVVAAIVPKKGSLENQRIDQFQEDLGALRDAQGASDERIDKLERMLVWYQRRDVAWELREARLMIGAERGEYPPWPDRDGILMERQP